MGSRVTRQAWCYLHPTFLRSLPGTPESLLRGQAAVYVGNPSLDQCSPLRTSWRPTGAIPANPWVSGGGFLSKMGSGIPGSQKEFRVIRVASVSSGKEAGREVRFYHGIPGYQATW